MPRQYVVISMLLAFLALLGAAAFSAAWGDQPDGAATKDASAAMVISNGPTVDSSTNPIGSATYYYGVMGEVARPGVYPDASRSVRLGDVLRACGGPTTGATMEVALVRNGRLSRHSIGPSSLDARLSAGDVIVVQGSQPPQGITPGRARVSASARRSTKQAEPKAAVTIAQPEVQLAFVNLIDRPVILKMSAGSATPRHIVKSLGQPAAIIPTIKIVEASRGNVVDYAEPDRNLASGSVLVFDRELIQRSRIPAALVSIPICVPRDGETTGAASPEAQLDGAMLDCDDDQTGPLLTPPPGRGAQSADDSDTPAYLASRRDGRSGNPLDRGGITRDGAAAPAEPGARRLSTAAMSGTGCLPGTAVVDLPVEAVIVTAVEPDDWQPHSESSWPRNAGSIFAGAVGLMMMVLLAVALRRMGKRESAARARIRKPAIPQPKLLDALIENRLPIEEEAYSLPAKLEFIGRRKSAAAIFVDASHEVGSPHESIARVPATAAASDVAATRQRTDAAFGAGKRIDVPHAPGAANRPAVESSTLLDRVLARVQGARQP